jgi:tRNA dimethylallyltransferase
MATKSNSPLIVVVGETASGKSALAMLLAEKFNGEIIAADSWTVYKDFNIGTAKPSAEDQKRVTHHLLDIADPQVGFSAAEYKRLALATIKDITQQGKLPILVGGTGLYIDSILFDYSFLPPASAEMREYLNGLDINALLAELERKGIDTKGVDLRNKRRLIRLLETDGNRPTKGLMRKNTLVVGVSVPRDQLQERIIARVDAMFADGLEAEVWALAKKYGWDVEPMKGIGYREFYEYYNGLQTLAQTRDRIISACLNLAKRQRTWFKRNRSVHWISEQREAVDIATTFLNKYLL